MYARKSFLSVLFICLAFFLVSCTEIEDSNVSREVPTEVEKVASPTEASTEAEKTEAETVTEVSVKEESLFDPGGIPEFHEDPFVKINKNIPFFTDEEKQSKDFELYSELDELGRCGVAFAYLSKEMMPEEDRSETGYIRPSGWHTVKYNDLIDGNYLFNRCHLIAFCLSGQSSNELNLITGTRFLNTKGMLPFECMVSDYISNTGNHVLYRVTPVFKGENLVASGVLMEGWSVEDKGKGICFNVYCYNVQPFIIIDYATGDSHVDEEAVAKETERNGGGTEGKTTETSTDKTTETSTERATDKSTETVTEKTTERTTEAATEPETESDTEVSRGVDDEKEEPDFIVNTKSFKIHRPYCSSVSDMAEHNKWYYYGTLEELLDKGYEPCKRCMKGY